MNNFQHTFMKHKPEILLGLGIGGFITSTVLAVKDTPKAIILLGRRKEELELEENEKLPLGEVIKTTWKVYLPTVITLGLSTTCIICAQKANNKKTAALATVASLSETALLDYKNKVIESIGEKKAEKIEEEVAAEKAKEVSNSTTIIVTGKGEAKFMDSISNQFFKSDREKIMKAFNDLNFRMRDEMFASLTDLYYELGIPQTDISDYLLWHVDDGPVEPRFIAAFDDEELPCAVIKYSRLPKYR